MIAPTDSAPSTLLVSSPNGNIIHRKGIVLACFIGEVRTQVVCVVEGETKSWKRRGQTGVVFETLEPGEEPNEVAVFRALNEELDLVGDEVVDSIADRGSFLLDVDEGDRNIVFEANVFLVQLKVGTQITNIVGPNDELQSRGMREVASLNGDTRPGTLLALRLAMDSRSRCVSPPVVFVHNGEEVQPKS